MFGVRFNAASRQALARASTPASGSGPEAIWHELYDTQTYVDNTTTRLQFFQVTNVDQTITNMPAAGQLPDPQYFSVYQICVDYLTQNTVGAAASVVGELNDIKLLMMVGRPVWTLTISDKRYGPYSLSVLHGTGAPVGGVDAGTAVEIHQWGSAPLNAGWNYQGSIIIPPKVNFGIEVVWAGAQNTTANVNLRVALFGILSRRVL